MGKDEQRQFERFRVKILILAVAQFLALAALVFVLVFD